MSKLGNLGALTGLEIEEEEEEDEVFDQTYEDHTTMEDDRQNSISIRCLFSPIFSFTLHSALVSFLTQTKSSEAETTFSNYYYVKKV